MRVGFLLFVLSMVTISSPETIPVLHGRSFSVVQVELPADLRGKTGILLIGFSQKSSVQTKLWDEKLLRDFGNDPHFAYYQCAPSWRMSLTYFFRDHVVNSIRDKMPIAERAHFVPILQDASKWKGAAGYAAPDDAYVLLVDGAGQIQWRTHGAPTGELYSAMKEHLAQLQSAR